LLFIASSVSAQVLRGTVTDAETNKPLYPVTVVDLDTRQNSYTDEKGNFAINVRPGDQIVFSYIGYKPQQRDIRFIAGDMQVAVKLQQINYQLDEFTVRPGYTPYQIDSLQRRSTYQRPLGMANANPFNSPVSALAQLFAPVTKARRSFQRNYTKWESQLFVDSRYSPELVTQLTGLTGDSLGNFMNAYPMPYDYARSATELEVKMWIRYYYKEWMKNGAKPVYVTDSMKKQ